MRIVHLTAGTGSYFCGTCMRDHALVEGLKALGHEALLVPLYLPLVLEDQDDDPAACPLFFGGINVYLQGKSRLFRHTPAWFDRLLDSRRLLRWSAGRATSMRELGPLTLAMLVEIEQRQAKELAKLGDFLAARGPWDVLSVSNALLMGVAPALRRRLGCPVVCTLQGEDSFLDGLGEPWRGQCWSAAAGLLREAAAVVPVSAWFGELMARRLALPATQVRMVHNGIDLSGFAPAEDPPAAPTVGFLARLCELKGLGTLVEAFMILARQPQHAALRLRVAGTCTAADRRYVDGLMARLAAAGLAARVDVLPNLSRAAKQDFLRSLTVLSVPAGYGEAFGLYIVEALACAVPVVQPPSGAFPELIAATGGGLIAGTDQPLSLAAALGTLLGDPVHARLLGQHGLDAVRARFTAEAMAAGYAAVCTEVVGRRQPAASGA